jgi:uncharacterized membrane protein YcaP (DUF421 family)
MWTLSAPWWEFVARAAIIYTFLLVLLRMTGKRQVGQLAPFDLVLLLILSNAVQNAMNAGDNSVLAGLILAVTLIALNHGVAYVSYRFRKVETFIEGRPEILVHDGKVFQKVLDDQQISELELRTALRNGGCASIEEVHLAILENNGHVSVIPKKDSGGK